MINIFINGELIKSSVALKLKESFKTGVDPNFIYPKIYKESTVQGFSKPCFFITTINTEQERVGKDSYRRIYSMNIRYHPAENTPDLNELLDGIGDELMYYLNSINVPIINTQTTKVVQSIKTDFKIRATSSTRLSDSTVTEP